jgi:hypothetical protein
VRATRSSSASSAARLHDHDADAVGDHVVHLARDPAALVGHRLLRLPLALLGRERGRLVQLGGVAQAQAHGPAGEPAEDHDRPREGDVGHALALDDRHGGGRRQQHDEHEAGAPPAVHAAAVGHDEHREEGRDELGRGGQPGRRGHRDHAQRDRGGERVAAPPEQRQAHRGGDEHVHPPRPGDALQQQSLGHGGHADGRGQRDVERPRLHAARSTGRRARTA